MDTTQKSSIEFKTTIPVFSWYIAKGMGVGLLMFVAIFAFIAAPSLLDGGKFSDFTPDIYFAFGFVGLIFFFTYVVMAIVFPKGFMSKITINQDGVSQVSISHTSKVNKAAIIGGIFAGKPGVVGTGMLAEAGNDRFVSWKEMKTAKVNPKSRYMYFSRGRLKLFPIGFFCPKEKYAEVVELVTKYFSDFQQVS